MHRSWRRVSGSHRHLHVKADSDSDHYEAIIQDPVYVGSDVGGIYDWDLVTVPQTQLDGGVRPMPQGKVLGGGSILNAMCWNRGGADDYDTWEALGNPGWGWEGMLPYFMKASHYLKTCFLQLTAESQSETYTPVYSEAVAEEYSIHFNPAVHGTSGPVQVSYPKYFYPQSSELLVQLCTNNESIADCPSQSFRWDEPSWLSHTVRS